MGYFQDTQTCAAHGFVLSPEGTCVRCRSEVARMAQRARIAKIVAGGVFAVTLLGVGVARGRMGTPEAPREITLAPETAGVMLRERPTAEHAQVTAPATHAALDAWKMEMAKADAAREAELAAKAAATAAAEKARLRAALEIPTDEAYTSQTSRQAGRVSNAPSSEDHPSWWTEPSYRRPGIGSIGAQQRAMAAAGVAPYNVTSPNAWLPANNGGNFTTRH